MAIFPSTAADAAKVLMCLEQVDDTVVRSVSSDVLANESRTLLTAVAAVFTLYRLMF